MSEQTEPSFKWTRTAAFIALLNMVAYPWFRADTPEYVYWALSAVVAYWALGSNGRQAIVEAVKAWRR